MKDTQTHGMSRRHFSKTVGLAALAVGASRFPTPAIAQGARQITFLFDVSPYGKHALFYPAIDNGYFKDAGLDVTIQAGKGSADVSIKIAAEAADFGFADAGTAILARGKDIPVKLVHMVHYKNMMNCTSLTDAPIKQPSDLVSKSVGATAGDAPRVALPGLAKINGFDASKVEIITVDSPSKPAMLMSGKVDGILGLSALFPVYSAAVEKSGKQAMQFLFADYGLDIYNNGIVVRDSTAAKDPELVKAFVNAIARSCIFAVEQPDEAVQIFKKHNPAYNEQTARAQLQVAIDHLMVPEVKEKGVGLMDETKMTFTLDIVREYFGLQGDVNLSDVYSNEFVTPGQKPSV